MRKEILIVLRCSSNATSKVWDCCLSWLKMVNLLEGKYRVSGELTRVDDISGALNGKSHFGIEGELTKIIFSQVHGESYKKIIIRTDIVSSSDLLVCSVADIFDIIQAYLVDWDYHYWQNAKDPVQYTSAGKPLPDLPMKSNGLPFPLEQQIFDTSRNPGRFVHRGEYVEAIGSPMWFSDKFWAMLGKEGPSFPVPGVEIRKQAGLTILDAGSEGFDEHSSVEIQNLLRQSIYG
jgi:hypothetical protein